MTFFLELAKCFLLLWLIIINLCISTFLCISKFQYKASLRMHPHLLRCILHTNIAHRLSSYGLADRHTMSCMQLVYTNVHDTDALQVFLLAQVPDTPADACQWCTPAPCWSWHSTHEDLMRAELFGAPAGPRANNRNPSLLALPAGCLQRAAASPPHLREVLLDPVLKKLPITKKMYYFTENVKDKRFLLIAFYNKICTVVKLS